MLTINNISKSFFHRIILENLSFKVKRGDTIALLGKNGIGKSTLLRILGKISQPDVGDILYKNFSIYKEKASVRKGMLYLGHDVGLYPSLSVIDNIKFACTVHGVKVKECSSSAARAADATLHECYWGPKYCRGDDVDFEPRAT